MNSLQTNYQALVTEENEVPHESVIFHVASEGGKSRWNHVGDLDSLFKRIYNFHQKHGYVCIVLEELMCVVFFVMICFGSIYSMNCIYFNFDEAPSPFVNRTDIHISELFMNVSTCARNAGIWTWILVVIGFLFVIYKCYKLWHIACSYDEIKCFYSTALKIDKGDISNITWHEVQCRLREVQHEQQLCVHKSDITELDIYHRILRHKNYMVAMINKNILPVKFNIKYLGEWVYLSSGLEYNIELLLFGSFSSPFKETGTLKEEYKKYSKRKEVADELARKILLFGLINAVCAPFIFVYQLISYFVTYSGIVKHSPGFLSTRKWSLYSRLYLRHFNELDHELNSRLNRAYRPAEEYMKSFSSPVSVIFAKFGAQVLGCAAVFLFVWNVLKEKLLMVEHVIFILTACSIAFLILNACIPDENAVFFPNTLMTRIVADVHYVPDHFKEKAHTSSVRDEFGHLFSYIFLDILAQLLSPLVTPYILLFHLRPRALDIVDFFRCFTVEVAGVGDVCSFALMDISRHGNQHWLSEGHSKANQHEQAEDGKTELSLIHFTMMNPHWQPPPSSNIFINEFKEKVNAVRDDPNYRLNDPFYTSLNSLSTLGSKYAFLTRNIDESLHQPAPATSSQQFGGAHSGSERLQLRGGMSNVEGPPYLVQGGILTSFYGELGNAQSMQSENLNPMEIRAADMSFSAIYLHEAHQRILESSRSHSEPPRQPSQDPETNGDEESPLLEVRISNYAK